MTETDFLECIQRKLRKNARSRYGVIPEDEREAFLDAVMLEVNLAFESILNAEHADDAFEFARRQLDELCNGQVKKFSDYLRKYATTQYIRIPEAIREEFVQDVMLAIQEKVRSGGLVKFPMAVARLAYGNKCRSYFRRQVHVEKFQDETRYQMEDGENMPDQMMMMNEMSAVIQKAVSRLKPKLRTAISLSCFAGLSNAEAAKCVKITISAFKTRLRRAMRALRHILQRESELNNGYFADD